MALVVLENERLNDYTTLQVGGPADYLVKVTNEDELREALLFAKKQTTTPPLILGGGSNVLCRDEGYEGLVIKIELTGINYKVTNGQTLVSVAAGEPWDAFVANTVKQGLCGLENLSGIPGTVGASPIQNINAYGATVGDIIHSVAVIDQSTLETKELTNTECGFGYRDSIFKHNAGKNFVVIAVTYKLDQLGTSELSYRSSSQSIAKYLSDNDVKEPTSADIRNAVLFARSNIGMLEGQFRSAGSCFKNVVVSKEIFDTLQEKISTNFSELDKQFSPWYWELPDGQIKIATAFLLECSPYNKSTFGEKRINHVGLSPKHSLSIVTESGAKSTDVEHFFSLIIDHIEEVFGVTLEREVLTV